MAKIEPCEHDSDRYDAWFDNNPDMYAVELEALRRAIPPPPARGLEVGVGSGKFAGPLGITTGVEPSEKMGIRVFRDVAENLPFTDCEFDFVLMVTTICFLDDIRKAFQEAYRVLKLAGCIVIGFIDRTSSLGKQYNAHRKNSVFYKDAVFFSPHEVGTYLKDAHFKDLMFARR